MNITANKQQSEYKAVLADSQGQVRGVIFILSHVEGGGMAEGGMWKLGSSGEQLKCANE